MTDESKKVIQNKIVELRENEQRGMEQKRAQEQIICELDQTILRIQGAIQALEEILAEEG